MIEDVVEELMLTNMPLFDHLYKIVGRELEGIEYQDEMGSTKDTLTLVEATDLVFAEGQPSCLFPTTGKISFRGHEHLKKLIQIHVDTLDSAERFKALLTGPAGTGKTTLAWIIADRIRCKRVTDGLPEGRFFEILPSQMENKTDLDIFMKQLQPYDVVFVDEIHILRQNVGAEPLYHTLDDTGHPRYPLGNNEGWINIPPTVSWIGATTEPGQLDDTTGGALRRRLSPELRLEAPDQAVLVDIILDRKMVCDKDAAIEMAKRSGGLPWQVLLLYDTARKLAVYEGQQYIDANIAQQTFDTMGVDKYGLFAEDRLIIKVLLQSPYKMRGKNGEIRYRMSETALCSASGVDKYTYKQIVQPRLMRLGFLTTVGGQCLTEKSLGIFKNDTH